MARPAPAAPQPAMALTHGRIPGLDALRAVAVGLVLAYHLFPGALQGGFIGVDVFFVLSGFLITTLLLREHQRTGTLNLKDFWVRRARRLLPAIVLTVLVVGVAATVIGGDAQRHLGRQSLTALLFTYNWGALWGGASYFDNTAPEVLRNFWSLAVEEQFYIVWPLILFLLLRVGGRWLVFAASLLIAVASATEMAVLAPLAEDPTRVYFGTDTHAFGLALGCALAAGLFLAPALRSATARVGAVATIALGLAALVALALVLHEFGGGTYPWGLLGASVVSLALIAAVSVVPAVGDAVELAPLRWIGERSFGMYLWHWPLVVLAMPLRRVLPVWLLGILLLAATVAIAAASYRWIEQPIRQDGFRATLRRIRAAWAAGGTLRTGIASALVAAVALVAVWAYGSVTAPRQSEAEQAIRAGEESIESASTTPSPSPAPTPSTSAPPSETPNPSPSPSTSWSPSPSDLAAVQLPEGARVTAIGDSVMLASAPALQEVFPGITIDATVSRAFLDGVTAAQAMDAEGTLGDYVIFGVATNGDVTPDMVEQVAPLLEGHRVVFVTAYGDRPWIPPANEAIEQFVADHPGTTAIAPWQERVAEDPSVLASDLIHPHEAGQALYAHVVEGAMRELCAYENAGGRP